MFGQIEKYLTHQFSISWHLELCLELFRTF